MALVKLKTGRFKQWKIACTGCPMKSEIWAWSYDLEYMDKAIPRCVQCGLIGGIHLVSDSPAQTVMIATDDIPGGIEIRHGICNPDGSPKRYYSKTDIKRAANEKGVTIMGDTPRNYKVSWSGVKSDGSHEK